MVKLTSNYLTIATIKCTTALKLPSISLHDQGPHQGPHQGPLVVALLGRLLKVDTATQATHGDSPQPPW
jgi:hypothetical protein